MVDAQKQSSNYLNFLDNWVKNLPQKEYSGVVDSADEVAIMVVDLTNGFCNEGPLASPRVKAIIKPIIDLLNGAHALGVRNLFLLNDEHDTQAHEFRSFTPHCIKGTREAEPVDEIKELSYFSDFLKISKNSISSNLDTVLPEILAAKPQLKKFIIVGDCTDLCVYQLAMYLNLSGLAGQIPDRKVIVPENCVQTYDLDIETAARFGAEPHPGDLYHELFLHHMLLNGIEVASRILIE